MRWSWQSRSLSARLLTFDASSMYAQHVQLMGSGFSLPHHLLHRIQLPFEPGQPLTNLTYKSNRFHSAPSHWERQCSCGWEMLLNAKPLVRSRENRCFFRRVFHKSRMHGAMFCILEDSRWQEQPFRVWETKSRKSNQRTMQKVKSHRAKLRSCR